MDRTLSILGVVLAGLAAAAPAPPEPVVQDPAPLKVVATVSTYGLLAAEIGGDLVQVVVVARPGHDPHAVTATPAFMGRVRGADLVLATGLDAEPWLDGLLRGSGNGLLLGDPRRLLAMSDGIALKEVPTEVSRRAGDIHAFGNTHVWTDPLAVRRMGQRVRDALIALRPDEAAAITERHRSFHDRLTAALVRWLTDYAGLKDEPVVVHHRSWVYFLDRFGLRTAGTIEPKPRVTPTAAHLEQLVETMREQGVKVIVREPYHDPQAAEFVAERAGAVVVTLATMPGWDDETQDVLAHFEHNLRALADALGVEVPGHP